jgi:transmembrane sensor
MEEKSFYNYLLHRYINGTATQYELAELFGELSKKKDDEAWETLIGEIMMNAASDADYDPALWEPAIAGILASAATVKPVRKMQYRRWITIAASIIILLSAGLYFWMGSNDLRQEQVKEQSLLNDIPPGNEGAILTLADGRKILLDSLNNGMIAAEKGSLVKLNNGQLSYSPTGTDEGVITYNTMTTPKGKKFQLVLPDGSGVWLNAGSSITYPTSFQEDTRTVDVTGEAYFEITGNKEKPFIVKTGREEIRVLGTKFNVNAYPDDPASKISLAEGAVRVAGIMLKRGQAFMQGKVMVTNIEQDIAWKNGVFDFEDAGVEAAMKQIERWYDVEVIYENGIPDIRFFGKLSRQLPLSSIIRALQESKLRLRMENDRKIIVLQ